MPSTETHLSTSLSEISSSQQVIFPEKAQFPQISSSTSIECSVYIVPALSGIFPSQGQSHIPFFEMDTNLTRIFSSEQERCQLHCDPDGINIFKLMFPRPLPVSPTILYAVQITRFAFPFTKACMIFIPKGKYFL
ncbi:unnamed protein product [Heterobilharzia americana]|nr:unnamed protein product [Heterobilharzia americana]